MPVPTKIQQPRTRRKFVAHDVPKRPPHALDQHVVAAWAIVIDSDAVESPARVEELRFDRGRTALEHGVQGHDVPECLDDFVVWVSLQCALVEWGEWAHA